ncbi:MAG: hypothetical protein U0414_15625 [Polyangiaceae bacterium]
MRASILSTAVLVLVTGCGDARTDTGGPSAPASVATATSSAKALQSSAPAAPPSVSAAQRAPDNKPFLSSVDQAFHEGAKIAGRISLARVRSKPWNAELEKERDGGRLVPGPTGCGKNALDLLEEVAFSGDGEKILAIGKLTDPKQASSCLAALGAKETVVEGRAAFEFKHQVIVVDSGFVAFGNSAWIGELMSGTAKPDAARAASVALGPDQILTFTAEGAKLAKGVSKIGGALRSDDKAFELVVDLDADDEDTAKKLEQGLKGALDDDSGIKLPITTVQKGARLTITLKKEGDGAAQSAFVGQLADQITKGISRYLLSAKTAEAKNTLLAISRAIREAMEKEGGTGAKFPASSTAVPAEVPKGKHVQSDPAEWKVPSWSAIRFSILDPQYFRYRWETAPDGKSLTVIAEGDLDGDGKLSTYKLKMELGPDGVKVDPKIAITDDGE